MQQNYTQCPKCGHKFPEALPASASCPSCGIFFFKWTLTQQAAQHAEVVDEDIPYEERDSLFSTLLQPLDRLDEISFYGRWLALLGLAIWSWFLIGYDYRIAEINQSFMHNILLPIHEAGHVIFRILGEFMMVLGGSLMQLLVPLGISLAFIVKRHDNFAAATGLWWASVSLVDLSAYIYDALYPQMTLIGGSVGDEAGIHDWINILRTVNLLQHAHAYGSIAHFLGSVLMVASLAWACYILLRQRSRLGNTIE